jgi:hypothetical protein
MARTKLVSRKAKKQPRKTPRVPRALAQVKGGLDQAALDYARLIADPCNGPLVNAPFGDGQSGTIARFEVDGVWNTTGTDVGSFLIFVPSMLGYYQSTVPILADGTGYTLSAIGGGPGSNFINTNAGSYRTLAACIQVYYPGSEQSRAGVTAVGQTNLGSVIPLGATTVSTGAIRTGAQYVERTPGTMVELKWTPNNYDMEWSAGITSSADGPSQYLAGRRSALVTSTFGIPVSTGMRYRMVAVVEYLPLASTGQNFNPPRAPVSRNTFQDVTRYLANLGNWTYKGANDMGHALSSLYAGGRAVGRLAYGTAKLAALTMG